jgi:hypothetical protein
MPILGIIASAITGNLVTSSYESIETVTVGSGGVQLILLQYLLPIRIYR